MTRDRVRSGNPYGDDILHCRSVFRSARERDENRSRYGARAAPGVMVPPVDDEPALVI